MGVLWTLLVCPLAGGIALATNWWRAGSRRRGWQLIASGYVATGTTVWAVTRLPGPAGPALGLAATWLWAALAYWGERRHISGVPGQKLRAGRIAAIALAIVQLGYGAAALAGADAGQRPYFLTPLAYALAYSSTPSVGGAYPAVTVGSSVDQSTMSVSGGVLHPGTVYARFADRQPVGASTVRVVLLQKVGDGWSTVAQNDAAVNPQFNVLVEPLTIRVAGTFRVAFIVHNLSVAHEFVVTG